MAHAIGMIGIGPIAEDLYAFAVKEELERQIECKLMRVGDGRLGSNPENTPRWGSIHDRVEVASSGGFL